MAVNRMGEPGDGRVAATGAIPVASYMISAEEWLLLAPPPGVHPGMLRRAATAWLDSAPPTGGSVVFVPVPSMDPALGLAVLHRRAGATVVYCEAGHLGRIAAEVLSLTAAVATPVLLASAGRHGLPRARIISVSHARWMHPGRDRWLEPSLHPVITRLVPPQATIYACDCGVSPALADTLTVLGSQQLRLWRDREIAWQRPTRLAT